MGEAQVEQPVVEVAAIGAERRSAGRDAADDDPERVDDRHAEHEQCQRDLGRAQDRQHGQRIAHGEDPGRADEDACRMEVVRQEARAATPASSAHSSATHWLDRRVDERDDAQRRHGDEGDAGQQPVEAVDEVDAVEHAHDPERRRRHRRRRC